MTDNDESPATPPERKAFHSTILDLAIADKTQVELFGAVGRTKGPFTGVIDWPYLNGLIEDQSRNISDQPRGRSVEGRRRHVRH